MEIKDLRTGIIELTPELAKKLKDSNILNRKENLKLVNNMAKDIVDGKWQLNGESLIISKTGHLLDGNHRCLAVLKANDSIITHITTNIDDDCYITLDSGKPRRVTDVLSINGMKNVTLLSATVNKIWSLENESFWCSGKAPSNGNTNTIYRRPEDVLDFIEKNNYQLYYVSSGSRETLNLHKFGKLNKPMLNALYYIFSKIDIDCANEFFYLYKTLDKLSISNPISVLRHKIDNLYDLKNRNISNKELAYYFYKTWNAWRKGHSYRTIQTVNGDCKLPKLI